MPANFTSILPVFFFFCFRKPIISAGRHMLMLLISTCVQALQQRCFCCSHSGPCLIELKQTLKRHPCDLVARRCYVITQDTHNEELTKERERERGWVGEKKYSSSDNSPPLLHPCIHGIECLNFGHEHGGHKHGWWTLCGNFTFRTHV